MIEVQGELELSAYERVAASALDHAEQGSIVVLDLSRVTRVEPGLAPLLADLAEELAVGAARLAIVVGPAGTLLEQAVDGGAEDAPWLADDLDTALECCETSSSPRKAPRRGS